MSRTAPSTGDGCHHDLLAESEHVSVARCDSGGIHLQMGPVTVSLTANEFAEVAAVIVCAIERLQRSRDRPAGRAH